MPAIWEVSKESHINLNRGIHKDFSWLNLFMPHIEPLQTASSNLCTAWNSLLSQLCASSISSSSSLSKSSTSSAVSLTSATFSSSSLPWTFSYSPATCWSTTCRMCLVKPLSPLWLQQFNPFNPLTPWAWPPITTSRNPLTQLVHLNYLHTKTPCLILWFLNFTRGQKVRGGRKQRLLRWLELVGGMITAVMQMVRLHHQCRFVGHDENKWP